MQQRGAVQPPGALGVPLQQLEPRPLFPQARVPGRLGRALVKELARRLRTTRAHQIPHQLPFHRAAGFFLERPRRVAESLIRRANPTRRRRGGKRRRRHLRRRRRRRDGVVDRARVGLHARRIALFLTLRVGVRRRRANGHARHVRRGGGAEIVVEIVVEIVIRVGLRARRRRLGDGIVLSRRARDAVDDRLRGGVRARERSEHLERRSEPGEFLGAHRPVVVGVNHGDEFIRRRAGNPGFVLLRRPHVPDHRAKFVAGHASVPVEIEHAEHAISVGVASRRRGVGGDARLGEFPESLFGSGVGGGDQLRERVRRARVLLEPALIRGVRRRAHLRRRVHRRRSHLQLHPSPLRPGSRARPARLLRVGPFPRQRQRAVQTAIPVRLGSLQVILRAPDHDVEQPVRDLLRAITRRERGPFRRRRARGILLRHPGRGVRGRPALRRQNHPHAQQIVHVLPRASVSEHLTHRREERFSPRLDRDARRAADERG